MTNLRLFGSVARAEERADSDVGLLADFPDDLGLLALGRLIDRLEAILGTTVDLTPASDLKPGVRQQVEPDLIPL